MNAFRMKVAAVAAALLCTAFAAQAQDYPAKPVKVVLPLQAGSASDIAVRVVTDRMGEALGRPLVVENVTGVGGLIGANRVVTEPADGYTIAALNMTILAILPHMQPGQVKFDPLRDFEPIYGLATIPTLLGVSASLPADNVGQLIALAKAKPGELNYSSGGPGSPQHLAAEMFQWMTGTKMTHVPYKGATSAAADLAAGRVQVMFIAHSLAIPFLPEKRIKLIGFTGAKRGASFPDLPTLDESGVKGYDYSSWTALYALKGTPAPVIARLRQAAQKGLATPGLSEQLVKSGLELWAVPPEELGQVLRSDSARWQKVVQEAGLVQK
ncbi:MAG TPA: tripartite tricarboxylate transporter substrate-binding protein [Burkholderiales bacterium]|nr:tripartite tricarboxylate transporter substrate-binding protein [Burkholderiales bacterium]